MTNMCTRNNYFQIKVKGALILMLFCFETLMAADLNYAIEPDDELTLLPVLVEYGKSSAVFSHPLLAVDVTRMSADGVALKRTPVGKVIDLQYYNEVVSSSVPQLYLLIVENGQLDVIQEMDWRVDKMTTARYFIPIDFLVLDVFYRGRYRDEGETREFHLRVVRADLKHASSGPGK